MDLKACSRNTKIKVSGNNEKKPQNTGDGKIKLFYNYILYK